jgi:hypothetical protein
MKKAHILIMSKGTVNFKPQDLLLRYACQVPSCSVKPGVN